MKNLTLSLNQNCYHTFRDIRKNNSRFAYIPESLEKLRILKLKRLVKNNISYAKNWSQVKEAVKKNLLNFRKDEKLLLSLTLCNLVISVLLIII